MVFLNAIIYLCAAGIELRAFQIPVLHIVYSSSTYVEMGRSITVRYTSGEWSGTLSRDMVSLGNTAPFEASFAVIDSSENFFIEQATWVGILGLGYSSLVKVRPGLYLCTLVVEYS